MSVKYFGELTKSYAPLDRYFCELNSPQEELNEFHNKTSIGKTFTNSDLAYFVSVNLCEFRIFKGF